MNVTRPWPAILAVGLVLAGYTVAAADDEPATRAETAAGRAEKAAERSEAAADRVDAAATRLERVLERFEEEQAKRRGTSVRK
jgi:hypothetical protein